MIILGTKFFASFTTPIINKLDRCAWKVFYFRVAPENCPSQQLHIHSSTFTLTYTKCHSTKYPKRKSARAKEKKNRISFVGELWKENKLHVSFWTGTLLNCERRILIKCSMPQKLTRNETQFSQSFSSLGSIVLLSVHFPLCEWTFRCILRLFLKQSLWIYRTASFYTLLFFLF